MYNTTPTPKAQGLSWGGGQKESRCQRTKKSDIRMYVLDMTDTTSIKSQQCGCFNKPWTMATPVDMPTWMGDVSGDSPLDEELYAILMRNRELGLP